MTTQNPLIRLVGLHRVYTTETLETHALAGVDLTIARGDYVTVEGPSGCGKSTLLSILGLIDDPTSGHYELAGTNTTQIGNVERARLRNREIGFVFQSFNLIPDMSVAENIALPLIYRGGLTRSEIKQKVDEVLDKVNMSTRAAHHPSQLSGGQQQRVAIGRALVGGASLILADEPTGNLDVDNGNRVMDLLDELSAAGATLVTVTHNPEYARRATRLLRMRDGCIVEESPAA